MNNNASGETMPELPEPQASMLERALREVLDMKERFTTDIINSSRIEDGSVEVSHEQIDEYYWAYA